MGCGDGGCDIGIEFAIVKVAKSLDGRNSEGDTAAEHAIQAAAIGAFQNKSGHTGNGRLGALAVQRHFSHQAAHIVAGQPNVVCCGGYLSGKLRYDGVRGFSHQCTNVGTVCGGGGYLVDGDAVGIDGQRCTAFHLAHQTAGGAAVGGYVDDNSRCTGIHGQCRTGCHGAHDAAHIILRCVEGGEFFGIGGNQRAFQVIAEEALPGKGKGRIVDSAEGDRCAVTDGVNQCGETIVIAAGITAVCAQGDIPSGICTGVYAICKNGCTIGFRCRARPGQIDVGNIGAGGERIEQRPVQHDGCVLGTGRVLNFAGKGKSIAAQSGKSSIGDVDNAAGSGDDNGFVLVVAGYRGGKRNQIVRRADFQIDSCLGACANGIIPAGRIVRAASFRFRVHRCFSCLGCFRWFGCFSRFGNIRQGGGLGFCRSLGGYRRFLGTVESGGHSLSRKNRAVIPVSQRKCNGFILHRSSRRSGSFCFCGNGGNVNHRRDIGRGRQHNGVRYGLFFRLQGQVEPQVVQLAAYCKPPFQRHFAGDNRQSKIIVHQRLEFFIRHVHAEHRSIIRSRLGNLLGRFGGFFGRLSSFPGGFGSFPGRFGSFPGRLSSFLDRIGNLLGRIGNLLGRLSSFPGGYGSFPGRLGSFPGRLGGFFGRFGSFPGGFGSFPGGFGSFPGGFGSFLSWFGSFPGRLSSFLGRLSRFSNFLTGGIRDQRGIGGHLTHHRDGQLPGDARSAQGGLRVHGGAQIAPGGGGQAGVIRQQQVDIGIAIENAQQAGKHINGSACKVRRIQLDEPVGFVLLFAQYMPRQQTVKSKACLADQVNGVGLVKSIQKFCLGGQANEQRCIQHKGDVLGVFGITDDAAERRTQVTQAAIVQRPLRGDGKGMHQVKFVPGIRKKSDGAVPVQVGGDIGQQNQVRGRANGNNLGEYNVICPGLFGGFLLGSTGFLLCVQDGVVRLPHTDIPGHHTPPFQAHGAVIGNIHGAEMRKRLLIPFLLSGENILPGERLSRLLGGCFCCFLCGRFPGGRFRRFLRGSFPGGCFCCFLSRRFCCFRGLLGRRFCDRFCGSLCCSFGGGSLSGWFRHNLNGRFGRCLCGCFFHNCNIGFRRDG